MALGKSLFSGIWVVEKELHQNPIVCRRVKWTMGWGSTMVQEAKPSQGTTKLEVRLGDCEYEKAVGIYCSPRKGLWGEDGQFLRAFSTHSCSVAQLCLILCDPMDCTTPSFPVPHYLQNFAQTHVHWVCDAIKPSCLPLPTSPALNVSQHQGLFKWVSSSPQVAKYWSFSFSISPSNEHPGLISFRMDWLDLFAVQGTLKILLQHHSSKASILRCWAFMVELTSVHDYWENHSFDSMDLCHQCDVSAF